MTTEFILTVPVDDAKLTELAEDLITTAVEGGINYWASVSDYHWDGVPTTVTVHEGDPGEGYTGPWTITATEMIEAIRKVVTGGTNPFFNMGYSEPFRGRLMSWLTVPDYDLDYDADDADCLMQIACLGEIVYG